MLSATLLVVFLRPRSEVAPPPIILEKQSVSDDTTAAAAAPPGSVAALVVDSNAPASAAPVAQRPAPKASAGVTRRTLAGAFQQRQGAIQGCFKQNPSAMVDTQNLSVRFDVDASGRVTQSLAVSPPVWPRNRSARASSA